MGLATSRPRSRSPVIRPVTRVALRRAFLGRQWVLDPVDADARRHDAGALAEVHAVHHERHEIQVIEPAVCEGATAAVEPGQEAGGDADVAVGSIQLGP